MYVCLETAVHLKETVSRVTVKAHRFSWLNRKKPTGQFPFDDFLCYYVKYRTSLSFCLQPHSNFVYSNFV